jgi:hypothetical protein
MCNTKDLDTCFLENETEEIERKEKKEKQESHSLIHLILILRRPKVFQIQKRVVESISLMRIDNDRRELNVENKHHVLVHGRVALQVLDKFPANEKRYIERQSQKKIPANKN